MIKTPQEFNVWGASLGIVVFLGGFAVSMLLHGRAHGATEYMAGATVSSILCLAFFGPFEYPKAVALGSKLPPFDQALHQTSYKLVVFLALVLTLTTARVFLTRIVVPGY